MLKTLAVIWISLCFLLAACNSSSGNKDRRSAQFSETVTLHKTTVIYFLNTECPICRKYQGSFNPIYKKFKKDFNFFYVFCGDQSEKSIKDFCDYDSLPYSCAVQDKDGHTAQKYGAIITPQVIILGADGDLYYSGKPDDRFESISSSRPAASVNYVENALNSLLQNEPVEIKKTDPVGCFIEPR